MNVPTRIPPVAHRAVRAVSLVLLALLALLAPAIHATYAQSTDDRVIARVGPETITAREVLDATQRLFLDQPTGDKATDRRRFLEPLIQAKLMVAEARARGLETPALLLRVKRFQNDFLVNELERVEVREKVVIPEEEIERAVELMSHLLYLRHILVADRATADSVLDELRAGADFDSLARAVSIDSTSARQGGQLPPMSFGSAEGPFIALAYALEPGVYGGPVQTRHGWHIVVQDSVRPRDADPEALRERAEETLRQGAVNQAQIAFLERLMDELDYTVQDSVVTLFAEQMRRWVDAGSPDWTGVDGSIDRYGFTAETAGQALFTYDDQEFTIGDFCSYMVGSPVSMTSLRDDPTRVRRDLVQYFYRRAASEMSRERGYLEASGYDREVRRQHEKALILALQSQEVTLTEPIPEAELRAHYEAHVERYMAPAQATVTRVQVPVLPATELLWRSLQRGMDLDEALQLAGPEIDARAVIDAHQVIRAGEPGWEAIESLAVGEATELGTEQHDEASSGDTASGTRRFLIVDERRPTRQLSFEEARDRVTAELRAKLEEQRYEALIARLKEKYPISVDTEALLALPLGG
ncbi:MAG: peptidylprolyl isomerase [Candidatus Eiseniibacteriota bacterium]|jgi:parvulin-like peptidyl-prolyl isomerase